VFVSATPRITTDARVRLGRHGEELAAAYLERFGFAVIARNERTRYGEIDLIVFDGATLAFVEVKTHSARRRPRGDAGAHAGAGAYAASELGWPSARQRRRLRRLGRAWLSDTAGTRPSARAIRFDLVKVLVGADARLLAIEHLEGAC
jgi:putative endonuclease